MTTNQTLAVIAKDIRTTEGIVLTLIFVILLPIWSGNSQTTNACLTGYAPESAGYADSSSVSLNDLVSAIAVVESGNNPMAMGDQNQAAGTFQLHRCALLDVNRKYRTKYSWPSDCMNKTTARQITKLYLEILGYNKKSLEIVVRRYNAGKYWKGQRAKEYWNKVKQALR
jgi:hypothetical protein